MRHPGMTSHKGQAKAKLLQEFKASLGDLGEAFQNETQKQRRKDLAREAARCEKACGKKKRYFSRYEAELAIDACEEHGTTGLRAYECPYCNGWHLTSKPEYE